VSDTMAKSVLEPLNKLLEANDRLGNAIHGTKQIWPYVDKCWIDRMGEPTKLLADHRLKNDPCPDASRS
jgi:GT2 family glycosyltransferase